MTLFRPGKPYRLLRLAADTAYLQPEAVVPFDVAESDGDFGFTTSGGQVEIDVAGLYLMTLSLARITAAASSSFQAIIRVNGVDRVRETFQTGNAEGAVNALHVDQLEVGDVVQFRRRSGLASSYQAILCHASITRIGPVRWT